MSESSNEFTMEETEKKYPHVHFEPGMHSLFKATDTDNTHKRFYGGDLRIHYWNKAVGKRMNEYSPQIISMDGNFPFSNPSDIDSHTKMEVWLTLPDRPAVLNPDKKEIFVVCGDPLDYQHIYYRSLPVADENELKFATDLSLISNDHNKLDQIHTAADGLGILASGYALYYALMRGAQRAEHTPKSPDETVKGATPLTRRQFLKLGGNLSLALTLAVGFGRSITPHAASFSPTEQSKDFFETITTLARPRMIHAKYREARTAILIAKEQDAMGILDLPATTAGAVVAGTGHTSEGELLLNNKKLRQQTIATYAEFLVNSIDAAIVEKYPSVDRKAVKNALLNYLCLADIVRVKDPGGDDHNPNLPNLVDGLVSNVGEMHSTQVWDAIKHLAV